MRTLLYIMMLCTLLAFARVSHAQTPITLTNQTTKIGGLSEEVFYLGFQAGDTLQLDLKEKRGKGLKEVEIIEYPDHTVFSAFKAKKIEGKQFVVLQTGIYKFRFYNSALGKRIGKIKVSRLPANDSVNFNSTVYWKTVYDTTYTSKKEEYIVDEKYTPKLLTSENSVYYINSGSNATLLGGKSRVVVPVKLPKNTVEWYYEIIASRDKEAIDNLNSRMSLFSKLTSLLGDGGTIGFALDAISKPPGGDVCDVYLMTYENSKSFTAKTDYRYFTQGTRENVKSDVVKLKEGYTYGTYYIGIKNPDNMHGINVKLEVVAIVHHVEKAERTIEVPHISFREVPYLRK